MARRARVDADTPFHIDLQWWGERGRNLRRFLAEMLGDQAAEVGDDAPLDFIDPVTAEVEQLDPLWVRVLMERAHQPDFITTNTPLTNAVLRAFIENLNRPMTVVQLHDRLNRSTPETLLRMLKAARVEYGVTPVDDA